MTKTINHKIKSTLKHLKETQEDRPHWPFPQPIESARLDAYEEKIKAMSDAFDMKHIILANIKTYREAEIRTIYTGYKGGERK